MRPFLSSNRGFTLVELLVVTAIFGIFGGAIYSLYITHMKTAFTREEVVDVQQNVRIAMDRLTHDIMMAGFLVPPESSGKTLFIYTDPNLTNTNPTLTNYSSILRLKTATADATFVRVNGAITSTTPNFGPITVAPASALARFKSGDSVRIIRPINATQPSDSIFTVITSNRGMATTSLNSPVAGKDYRAGDVISKVNSAAAPYPETVTYTIQPCVSGNIATSCLARSVNGGTAEMVAQYISSVKFGYLLEGDDTQYKTSAVLNDPEKLSSLRAIHITVAGQTTRIENPGSPPKTRQLQSLVRVRNKR